MPLRKASIPSQVRNLLLFALSSRSDDEDQKVFQANLDDGRALSVLVSPVYVETQMDSNMEADGWVIVLQDVTHLRQAEIARTQFIQAAAHDMRNPLGVTIGSLDMLTSLVNSDDPTVREVIEMAMHGVRRVQTLIDDLLNLEHLESGAGFQMSEVSVGDLIELVYSEIWSSMQASGLTFKIDAPPNLPAIQMDKKWVSRAVLNYLDNACKYTPSGGSVTLRVFINHGMLHIEVEDTGPGIPVEAQARVFERFYRVHNGDSRAPGSGLGLAIVKSVAEAHGGGVYVQSRPGHGSTFGMTIMIPE
jgi:signal transduction histidine kinase